MKFRDIPGHESVKNRLRTMADSGRLPHALLLEGPPGIGKMALARAFAQYIHCENPTPDGEPCGQCQACLLHESMNHIDVQWVYPVVKLEGMNSAPTSEDFAEQWREYIDDRLFMDFQAWSETFPKRNAQPVTYVTESALLLHRLAFTSHVSKQKIVLWWLPEKMNEEAANKLLKIIEEPQDDTLFIMVSDRPAGILPTIYSRLQRIRLRRLSDEAVAQWLMANREVSPDDAMAAAHIAEGSVTEAMGVLARGGDRRDNFELFIKLMRLAYKRDVAALRQWADELAAMGRECEIRFYEQAVRLVRENFVYNYNVPDINYMTTAEAEFASKFARFITEANVERLIDTFSRAASEIGGNGNGRIINLDVAIRVIMLLIPGK